jgi:hypothetical protein
MTEAESTDKTSAAPRGLAEKTFTTEPKIHRHLYGMMATRKRAALLMELLFQNDFVLPSPYYVVKGFLIRKAEFIGLDPRTILAYIGRPAVILRADDLPKTDLTIRYKKSEARVRKEYSAERTLPEKWGFCQQLGYMNFEYRGPDEKSPRGLKKCFIVFHHKEVPLPYHLKQMPLLDSEKSEVMSVEVSKDDLCVGSIEPRSRGLRGHVETVEIESRERRVSKQHTQICSNLESESIQQRAQKHSGGLVNACSEGCFGRA